MRTISDVKSERVKLQQLITQTTQSINWKDKDYQQKLDKAIKHQVIEVRKGGMKTLV